MKIGDTYVVLDFNSSRLLLEREGNSGEHTNKILLVTANADETFQFAFLEYQESTFKEAK